MMAYGCSGRSFFSPVIYQSDIFSANSFIASSRIIASIFQKITIPFKNLINQIDNIYIILQIN
jgi:hypothetical protein